MHLNQLNLNEPWVEDLLLNSRLGHLGTSTKIGIPHVVPICYVYDGKKIYSPIDEKPKKSASKLRRLLNITENPHVCITIDRYEEDWSELRYAIIHGKASIIRRGKEHQRAIVQLREKYSQYHLMNLEVHPIIKVSPSKLVTWRSSLSAQ